MPGAVVVGTGFGARVHVPALRAAGFDVVALVGRDPERTRRRADRLGIAFACTELDDALARPGADAVTIATPPHTHAPLVLAAVGAGRHVVCEKPFALDRHEAVQMQAAAQAAGVVHAVGYEFRWAPHQALLARAVAGGLIGEPRLAAFVQQVGLVAAPDAPMPDWWFDGSRGGGWLGASGSHLVDQVRTCLGEIATVAAALPTVAARAGGAEDSFSVRFSTAGGTTGVLQQTAASWSPGVIGTTTIAGTTGTIEVADGTVWCADASGRRALAVPDDLRLPEPSGATVGAGRFTHLELGPYTRLCEAFAAAIAGRPAAGPVAAASFADGVAAMRVLDAIRASASNGGALTPVVA